MNKNLLFVFNPHSGKSQIKNKLMEIIQLFSRSGYQIEIHATGQAKEAEKIVQERGKDKQLIVCAGGDGTLHETLCGIMQLDTRPILGYIPTGTTNDFACSLGLSKNLVTAAKNIILGKTVSYDIGLFDQSYFAYIAAFGLFTDIPYLTPQELKRILGYQAYLIEAVKRLSNIQPIHILLRYDKKEIEGDFIYGMITNATQIAGMKNIMGRNVKMDDGIFEGLLLHMPNNPLELGDILAALFSTGHKASNHIHKFRSKKIEVFSDSPIPWVLDGEFGGNKQNVQIQSLQRAIRIQY
ncbi:diacylglycerol kinase [Clostridia bacterium]|nr:diacylglycerol kinase [Clostridia bacterium]